MFFNADRTCLLPRPLARITVVALCYMLAFSTVAKGQSEAGDEKSEFFQKFQEVAALRADREYGTAIEKLSEIVKNPLASDQVLKSAYHHLVWTYEAKGDSTGARASAREALERYPDLAADEISFPIYVNDYYDVLRREMFGSLRILQPMGCRLFLNDQYVGDTPLRLDLVQAGEYDLTLTKSGYRDYTEQIRIGPEERLEKTLSLQRTHDWKWWTYRVGAGVAAASLVAVVISGGDEGKP
ncbi:MAG: PEGA domain-containing protein, partial [Candidatus Latescibacterota bacterium]